MTYVLSRLAKAILLNQLDRVQSCLEDGDTADVEVTEEGLTGLMYVSYWGEQATVKLLLEHGANPNAALKDGTTALMKAVEQNHSVVVLELLRAGAQVGLRDQEGRNALDYAVQGGLQEMALILTQGDASLERDQQLAELLFGGVHYKEVEAFCTSNFDYDFSKSLLILLLSEILFGSPASVYGAAQYRVDMCMHRWEPDSELSADVQLTRQLMSYVGISEKRVNEINSNPFRSENYGMVYLKLVASWMNKSLTLGDCVFSTSYTNSEIWLTCAIDQAQTHTLDMFPREKGRGQS